MGSDIVSAVAVDNDFIIFFFVVIIEVAVVAINIFGVGD